MELKCIYFSVILIELLPLKIITKKFVRTSSTSDNDFSLRTSLQLQRCRESIILLGYGLPV